MAETLVKIVSNPYERSMVFQRWDNGWVPITYETNPNSRLLNDELARGFFPFKAKEIVDVILNEYRTGNAPIRIVFEGADDEYLELAAVCETEAYADKVVLERDGRSLPNARDVLPAIVEVFRYIRPLVDECVFKDERIVADLEKFYDVSSDVIPICVLGNCSAGKSTFINALIGCELLPSGDEPVTAKVYQIARSSYADKGTIKFQYLEEGVTLEFGENGLVANGIPGGSALDLRVAEALSGLEEPGLVTSMNRVLEAVNSFRDPDGGTAISDKIDVNVPFCKSNKWGQGREFVILDTPGSNTVSNADHLRVLKDAMTGLSNGLPVYVATYDSLDSKDNVELYGEISQIEAIDERFAMVIVNKADAAALPAKGFDDDDIKKTMAMGVPRNLYAQGIYFVSSILGLGSKTKGVFASDYYAERFEDQERKYTNPESRFYKTLYRYNILPGQIWDRTVRESEACDDLLYANSGLYCVEREIELFAEKYAAYNKCHQSEALFKGITEATIAEIEAAKVRREFSKKAREEALDRDKAELVRSLEESCAVIESDAVSSYSAAVEVDFDPDKWSVEYGDLAGLEATLVRDMRELDDYDGYVADAENARKAIGDDFFNDISDAFNTNSANTLGRAFTRLAGNIGRWKDKQVSVLEAEQQADSNASDKLLEGVREDFEGAIASMSKDVDEASQSYWGARAEAARDSLRQLATTNAVLLKEKRDELARIIIQYPPLELASETDDIFVKSELEKGFRLWNLVIVESSRLNLGKLRNVYNSEIKRALKEVMVTVKANHEISFKNWLQDLLGQIVGNITDYNPVLHNHVEIIREDTERINDLTEKLVIIELCSNTVSQMLSWRE